MNGLRVPLTRIFLALLFLQCLNSPSSVFAQKKTIQQYVHDVWTTANGLPQNSAADIVQTNDGYLWFATQEGLARFDGVRFTVFDRTNTPALTSSWMQRLMRDSDDGVWMRPQGFAPAVTRYKDGIFKTYHKADGLASDRVLSWACTKGMALFGTDHGLSLFKDNKFTTLTRRDGLPSDTVTSLTIDSRGRVWIGFDKGVCVYEHNAVRRLSAADGFLDTTITRLYPLDAAFEDSKGRIWLAAPHHVYTYTDGRLTPYALNSDKRGLTVNAMHEDRLGTVWLATEKGLYGFNAGRFTYYEASKNQDENTILQIVEDQSGDLWLATGLGIKRFSRGIFESYRNRNGLTNDIIDKVFLDREGSIWIGTEGGGLDRFHLGKFVTLSMADGLSDNMIQPIIEDHQGALWIGTAVGGVDRLKDGVVTVVDSKKGLPSDYVQALGEDKEGAIWIGTTRGAVRLEGDHRTVFLKKDGIVNDIVSAFIQRRSGEFLLASGKSVMEVKNGKIVPYHLLDSVQTFVTSMIEDHEGTMWILSRDGVYRLNGSSLHHFTEDEGLKGRFPLSFYEDTDGVIWMGMSEFGLYRYKNKTFTLITPQQGLFDYNPYNIFEDQFGNFWMSSNRGIFRVAKKELNDVADGKKTSVRSTVYGEADGMANRECNGGYSTEGAKLRDGRLCFATVRGVAIVNPADISLNPVAPPVVIENFTVDGKPRDIRSTLKLPAGSSKFEFHYTGMSFVGGEKAQFKYKLEGFDHDWFDAGTRRDAYYTNLPPGDYVFRVIAANSDGVWNNDVASVSFVLEPYFYQSSWFLALGVFLFLTTGPSIYFMRTRQLKSRAAELNAVVEERTSALQQTLDHLKEAQNQLVLSEKMASLGQLTAGIAHEIKNPLNFITNFAVLSQDLTRELRQELLLEKEHVDAAHAEEIKEILDDLEQNVGKINDHGKRADSIVRGMLLHSRGKAGERQLTDLNALLAEYTNLAYHGMRAQDQSFNIKIETDFDPTIGKMNIVPQDLSRAFLNIVNNACYAANEKKKGQQNGFMPVVRVCTKNLGRTIEIRIRDNGTGIPQSVLDKIFNPFFTTKPAGVGTGLGLSLTYDTITQEHKGKISVDTKVGEYTEFIITLPNEQHENGGVA